MDLCVDLLSSSIWAPKRFGEQSVLMCPFRLMCRRPSVSDLLHGIWILQDTTGIEDTASTATCFLVLRWRNGYAVFCFPRQTTVTPTPLPRKGTRKYVYQLGKKKELGDGPQYDFLLFFSLSDWPAIHKKLFKTPPRNLGYVKQFGAHVWPRGFLAQWILFHLMEEYCFQTPWWWKKPSVFQ